MTARPQRRARLPRGPFSRYLEVDDVPDDGLEIEVAATAEECLVVAKAAELPAVGSLSARFAVARRAGGRFEVTGTVAAQVTRTCVVSLDPFKTTIEQGVDLTFATQGRHAQEPRGYMSARRGQHESDRGTALPPVSGNDDQVDPPDPIIDGAIDLGAVAVEFLILACEPYPRKPGVAFVDVVVGDDVQPSPFAALRRLKEHP